MEELTASGDSTTSKLASEMGPAPCAASRRVRSRSRDASSFVIGILGLQERHLLVTCLESKTTRETMKGSYKRYNPLEEYSRAKVGLLSAQTDFVSVTKIEQGTLSEKRTF